MPSRALIHQNPGSTYLGFSFFCVSCLDGVVSILRSELNGCFGRGSLAALTPFQQTFDLKSSPHVSHFGLMPVLSLFGLLFFRVC